MSGRQTAQHDGATHEEKDTKHQPTVQLDAPLRQLMSHGRPSAADVVAVMRKYPMARIAMMETIHRELGNQFAHEVSTELHDQSANTLASTNTSAPLGPMGALRQAAKPVFELAKGGDLAAILKSGHTYETFADQQITTLNGVMPGYVKARNALDRDGVQQVGMVIMSSLELLRAAISGLGEQLGKHVDPLNCAPGADAAAELQGAEELGQLEALQSRHKQLVTTANHIQQTALMTMTPRDYRGSPLPDAAAPTAHVGAKGLFDVRAQVNEELVRTLTIINCAERLFIQFADPKALHDPQKRQLARHDIGAFAHRPADLTFLRAILMGAGLWQQLDSEDEHKSAAKPAPLGLEFCKESDGPLSSLYSETKKQAEQLGWLTDIGNYDRYMADLEINIGSSEGVTNVWARIMSAPADGRAQILYQMQRRGMFKPFFDKLPWHYTKELHDGLPGGHGDLKTELQKYFLVKGKWGTSLENQEYHAPSLTKMIHEGGDAVGGWGESVIDGFDSALNFMTFGFTHGYGQAQDAHSQGLITDDEYATAVRQVSTRAAVGMAIMMATGGMGRGAGAAAGSSSMGAASLYPSVAGTAMATGVEGAMFATTEMFALDTTDIVTGAKDQYSDATDYLKAAMIGGMMGAAVGGTSRFLTNRVAAQYAAPGLLTRGQSIAAQHPNLAPVLREMEAFEQGAATEVRLTATQVDDLARSGLIDAGSHKALREALANNQEVRAVVELHESLNSSAEPSANSAGNTSGKGKAPALTVKNATPVTGEATTAAVSLQATLPKGAIIKRVGGHGNDGWVQYELNGQQRIRFRAVEAKTLSEANKGRNYSREEGAGINQNNEVFVLEGRHRAVGAANGDSIEVGLGGVPGQPGVLDFKFRSMAIEEEGVFVRDLKIDYDEPDVGAAEADFMRSQKFNKP